MSATSVQEATATDRISKAITALLESYRGELDGDGHLRSIRVVVRMKPGGAVDTVDLDRSSSFQNTH